MISRLTRKPGQLGTNSRDDDTNDNENDNNIEGLPSLAAAGTTDGDVALETKSHHSGQSRAGYVCYQLVFVYLFDSYIYYLYYVCRPTALVGRIITTH